MSSDNCIAILHTKDTWKQEGIYQSRINPDDWNEPQDVYRVCHQQAPDNFDYYLNEEFHNLGWYLESAYRDAKCFYNYDEAFEYAKTLDKDLIINEYGIIDVDASDYNFPGM